MPQLPPSFCLAEKTTWPRSAAATIRSSFILLSWRPVRNWIRSYPLDFFFIAGYQAPTVQRFQRVRTFAPAKLVHIRSGDSFVLSDFERQPISFRIRLNHFDCQVTLFATNVLLPTGHICCILAKDLTLFRN